MLGPMSEALQLHRATLDNGMRVVVNPDTTSPGLAVNTVSYTHLTLPTKRIV